jgi:hypothetical protein
MMKHSAIQTPRKRGSCLGDIVKLFFLLVILGVGYFVVIGVFAPWTYYLGGSFHLLPIWQGWGTIQEPSGNFPLYVFLSRPETGKLGISYMSGTAQLCTPRGEQFGYMRVIMAFQNKNFGLDSENQPVTLHIYNYGLSGRLNADHRPEFDLYGAWQGPNLVLEDHGSFTSAFLPDGTVYVGSPSNQPAAGANLSITLVPGSPAQFKAACQSLNGK